MKFFSVVAPLFLLAGLVVASAEGVAATAPKGATGPKAATAPKGATKRACTPSNCFCNGIQGEFCGISSINPDCITGHVYECSPTGATCDFGVRDSCVECNQLVC